MNIKITGKELKATDAIKEYLNKKCERLQKYSERDIINSKLSLLGAEIKYWFYIHKIDLESEKYSGFSSYLDFRSTSKLMDDKYYVIFAEYVQDKDIYRDCKIVIDKYKEENKE